MSKKTLVTMALPYANGSLHLGHLVEAVQTDVHVRALRAAGKSVLYICADDTHGTPIEVNAAKAGLAPEAFVARFHEEHQNDYASFRISFDEFYTTHSPENEKHAGAFFRALQADGGVDKREVEQLYCDLDKRFLPDRFVKGQCPKCGAKDQYGDACEKCGSTYEPTDLAGPHCSICKDQGRGEVAPVRRSSAHYFVKLSKYQDFLKTWTASGALQPEILRSINAWLGEPLKDWDISRDAPYFGFKIPGEDAKYFYVWLDAPIGYLSSTEHWVDQQNALAASKATASGTPAPTQLSVEDYWGKDADCDIVHFIGKDIVYFHTLFWPAMLHAAGRNTPAQVHVHGMLTVEGAKMSKSRGTFIRAREFLEAGLDPEWLRYFFASNLGQSPSDIDLSLTEMKNRVNGELLGNIGNLTNRALALLFKGCGGNFAHITGWDEAEALWKQAQLAEAEATRAYLACDTRSAIHQVLTLGSLMNERLQRTQPWKLLATDLEAARRELTLAANIARVCARLLSPVVPTFAERVGAQLGAKLAWGDWAFLEDCAIAEPRPLVRRMEDKDVLALASRFVSDGAGANANPIAIPAQPPTSIPFEHFAALDLRAGKILAARKVPKTDKLLELSVELGEPSPRTIVAGLALAYGPDELVGKTVVVVANLAKKLLRGLESHGMVLAATGGTRGLAVIELGADVAPGSRVK